MDTKSPSPYTFKELPTGLIETYQDGQRISTGTADSAQTYGYTPKVSAVSLLSTENAQKNLQTKLNTLNNIAPIQPEKPKEPVVEKPKTNNGNTVFVNADTGQEYSFNADDLKNPTNQTFIKQNNLQFLKGQVPSFIVQSSGTSGLQSEVNRIDTQLEDLVNNFNTYNIDTDPQFQAIASGITKKYDQLRAEMRKTNESRQRAYETLGLRTGASQYASPIQMGIEGEELNQANQRIADLTQQEQEAINSARASYQSGKWTEFNNKVNALEKIRENKAKELENYTKRLDDNLKALRDQNQKQMEEINKAQMNFEDNKTSILKLINDPNIPKEVFDLIGNAQTPEEVYKLASSYIIPATADLNEYRFYQQQEEQAGKKPLSFYQWKATSGGAKDVKGKPLPVQTLSDVNKISSLDDIRNLPVSNLTKAVMSGFGKLKELTPTQKAQVIEEMYQVGFNPNTYVMNKLTNLVEKWASIPEEDKGYLEGRKFWSGSMNPNVADFESAQKVLTREIARLNDVGVLSNQDVDSYSSAMPSRTDKDLQIVLSKIKGLSSTITGSSSDKVGQYVTLPDGRQGIIGVDGETILDPATGKELK